MSLKHAFLLAALAIAFVSTASADEPAKLPKPLDGVTLDLGLLKKQFQVVETRLYESKEFKSLGNPAREIAEQTLVWKLEAKTDVTGKAAAGLFERPAFPRVRFYSFEENKRKPADAREMGYFLATDRRWIRGDGEALKKGDRLTVYTPIGKTGAADLVKEGASVVVFEKAKPAKRAE